VLKQAIDPALEPHPFLNAAGAGLKAAEARTEQIKSLFYPQVFADFASAAVVGGINPRFMTPAGSMLRRNLRQDTGGVIANQRLHDFGFTRDLVESSDLAARAQARDLNGQRTLVLLNMQRVSLTSLKRCSPDCRGNGLYKPGIPPRNEGPGSC
jgi:outer membrane protein